MKTLLYSLSFLLLGCLNPKNRLLGSDIKKNHSTNDSFYIQKKVISTIESDSIISLFILDANLDNRVEHIYQACLTKSPKYNYNIIGIGHEYFSNSKRKRDFIPAKSGGFFDESSSYFGQADHFLQFLVDSIVSEDSSSDFRILVGHSFGGLFATYVSTLEQTHFQRCVAVSPSLWLNRSSFLKVYEEQNRNRIHTPLDIYYGGLEKLNKIAPSCLRFNQILTEKDRKNVSIKKISGETHLSIIDHLPSIVIK